ncbi:MAG: heme exporter protein CcmD [Reinekea sp.]|jgi:heme exporter protein D
MAFESVADFLAMGGHGLYVWLSYGIAGAVFIYNLFSPRLMRRRLIQDMKRRQRRGQL